MKTREQWVEEVLTQVQKYAEEMDDSVSEYDKLRALLLEVPDQELTMCRHCGFKVKLNEAPEPEYKGE